MAYLTVLESARSMMIPSNASYEQWKRWARDYRPSQSRRVDDLLSEHVDPEAERHMSLPVNTTSLEKVSNHKRSKSDVRDLSSHSQQSLRSKAFRSFLLERPVSKRDSSSDQSVSHKRSSTCLGKSSGQGLDLEEALLINACVARNGSRTSGSFASSIDEITRMASLKLTSSLVEKQEAIWQQIKADNAKKKARSGSDLPGPTISVAWHDSSSTKPTTALTAMTESDYRKDDIVIQFQGVPVRIVPQSQVEQAWRRGECVIMRCCVCSKKLLATLSMQMVYCPICGSLSNMDYAS